MMQSMMSKVMQSVIDLGDAICDVQQQCHQAISPGKECGALSSNRNAWNHYDLKAWEK